MNASTIARLSDFKGGWIAGNFEPTLARMDEAEVAIKHYKAGECEDRHYHKVAVELTAIVTGRCRMNEHQLSAGDVIRLEPGTDTDFEAYEDTITVVVKTPCVPGDKYMGSMLNSRF